MYIIISILINPSVELINLLYVIIQYTSDQSQLVNKNSQKLECIPSIKKMFYGLPSLPSKRYLSFYIK